MAQFKWWLQSIGVTLGEAFSRQRAGLTMPVIFLREFSTLYNCVDKLWILDRREERKRKRKKTASTELAGKSTWGDGKTNKHSVQLVFIAYIKSTSAAVHCKWQALCCGGRCLRLRLTCVWLLHSVLLPRILQFGARLLRFLTLLFFFLSRFRHYWPYKWATWTGRKRNREWKSICLVSQLWYEEVLRVATGRVL